MGNTAKYDKYFYFRAVTDEDNDDDQAASVMVPVNKITALEPNSAITNIRVWFESEANYAMVQDRVSLQNGYVDLTITRGKLKEVMEAIVAAMNAGPHSDGVTVIADDVTTDFLGTTRPATYIHPDITACSAVSFGY